MSVVGGLYSIYSICSFAAGIAGNLFAFVLFVSPIPTFRRIIRSKSTEQFSGLPYIYTLLNCLICLWYGTPIVSPGIILVFTVNSIGAVFQLVYITIFIIHAEGSKKLKMLGLVLGVFAVFAAVVAISLTLFEPSSRQTFVGYLSVFSLICMFASPLFIINLVIKTKSVEYMPFYLSLATFLMSLSFFAYGMCKNDPFISVPNGIGGVLGVTQLVLYFRYSNSEEEPRAPLLDSYA
ncbi:bidirectional sugar transporter SWEET2a [Solanum lycopersicum]|uniref:Bidirectional sugar transporter SWEET n=2 Tax=Solanum subgen. Lycopersicon TaxID=49274 RepID=A0A3Q7F2G0_SOLLC|nr:bidirectional sugar transporter SWEET2a [Solanum lycopersicum]XP_015063563.1 bidirectional sugar transporter SWEET2a-like [Solanum pennellii]